MIRHLSRTRTGLLASGLVLALLALAPSAARGNVPDPTKSDCDSCLVLAPAGGFAYVIVLRDDASVPIDGATVVLDFNGTGIGLCTESDPDTDGRVTGVTDAFGEVQFFVRGGGTATGFVTVSSQAATICLARPRSPDLDGNRVVEVADQTAHGLLAPDDPAGDYDCDGDADAEDAAAITARIGDSCATVPAGDGTWGRVKALYR